jgi:hypothetical protein
LIKATQSMAVVHEMGWLWLAWQQPRRPWMNFPPPCDQRDQELFASATSVQIGNGQSASFWTSTWLGAEPLCRAFPNLFRHSKRKSSTVEAALTNEQWIRDLRHGNTTNIASEFL